jgi:hypothetical protein
MAHLEPQLHTKLNLTRVDASRTDDTVACGSHGRARQAKDGMVWKIEELRPEFQIRAFSDPEDLLRREVEASNPWTGQYISAACSEPVGSDASHEVGAIDEGACVEPKIRRRIRKRRAQACRIRAASRIGVLVGAVAGASHRERKARGQREDAAHLPSAGQSVDEPVGVGQRRLAMTERQHRVPMWSNRD